MATAGNHASKTEESRSTETDLTDPNSSGDEDNPTAGCEQVLLEASMSPGQWRHKLRLVWENQHLTDMTLLARGTSIELNTMIMLLSSSKMDSIILKAEKDGLEKRLQVEVDVDPADAHLVLEFLHLGEIEVARTRLPALAAAAHALGISYLEHEILGADLHRMPITVHNCLIALNTAVQIKDEDMVEEGLKVACEHFGSLQHSAEFKALSAEALKQLLQDSSLKIKSQDERLFSLLIWVKEDPPSRQRHLCDLLDVLPLWEMEWFLDNALHDPLITNSPEALRKLKAARDPEKCLIITGHSKYLDKDHKDHSSDVLCVAIKGGSEKYLCSIIGSINSEYNMKTNCCVWENRLYVCGLGPEQREIWQFDLGNGMSKLLGKLRSRRRGHSMILGPSSKLMLIGGHNPATCTNIETVEILDPTTGLCETVGRLQFQNCHYNLRSCVLGQDIVICGAWNESRHTTLQVWSPTARRITNAITLRTNIGWVSGIILCGPKLVLLGNEATVVINVDDLMKEITDSMVISDKYTIPNTGCAVSQTKDGHITLVGGVTRESCMSYHPVYVALIHHVARNTGPGWQPLNTQCTIGECMVWGYSTAPLSATQSDSL